MRPNTENIVSFDSNDLLKGTEFLGELIDAAINHQPLNVEYRTFAGNERTTIIHPYHIKQFNNRWFIIGLQEGSHGKYITNKALDRIVKISRANVPFPLILFYFTLSLKKLSSILSPFYEKICTFAK